MWRVVGTGWMDGWMWIDMSILAYVWWYGRCCEVYSIYSFQTKFPFIFNILSTTNHAWYRDEAGVSTGQTLALAFYSLSEYISILYLEPKMQIWVQGHRVLLQKVKYLLYKPMRCQFVLKSIQTAVEITYGFNKVTIYHFYIVCVIHTYIFLYITSDIFVYIM